MRSLLGFADAGGASIGIIGLAVIVVLILAGIGIGAYSRRLRGIVRSRIYLAGLALRELATGGTQMSNSLH